MLWGVGLLLMWARSAGAGSIGYVIQGVVPLAISFILMVVVIQDHLEGKRYPWSHWMGVALRLWLYAVAIVWYVWMIIS